jgi:glycosyltransferase involved in cell wall biosynthesis
LKVLHILGTARPGGVETFVLQLARDRPPDIELSVCILGNPGPVGDMLGEAGASVSFAGSSSGTGAARAIVEKVSSQRYDIVHANSGGRLVRLLSSTSRGHVISHLHGIEESWLPDVAARGPGLTRRVKSLATGADEVAVSSSWMRQLLNDGNCPKPVALLRYGVDVERFSPEERERMRFESRASLGIDKDAKVVGFVGRLVRQKGPQALRDLALELSDDESVRVVICGDGPARGLIQTDPGPHITFAGERTDIPFVMSAFDVTVMTSEWEPFGIVALESAAMGIPVAAFTVGGLDEAIEDGQSGALVPQGDVRSLAKAVRGLLHDTDAARSMGERARQRVISSYDSRNTSASVFDHYRAITNSSFS